MITFLQLNPTTDLTKTILTQIEDILPHNITNDMIALGYCNFDKEHSYMLLEELKTEHIFKVAYIKNLDLNRMISDYESKCASDKSERYYLDRTCSFESPDHNAIKYLKCSSNREFAKDVAKSLEILLLPYSEKIKNLKQIFLK